MCAATIAAPGGSSPSNRAEATPGPVDKPRAQDAGETRVQAPKSRLTRPVIFTVQVTYLLALGIAAAAYFLPEPPAEVIKLGSIPIGVVWFGALGAVLVSLTSVVDHANNWDPSKGLWHLSRPLVGALLAVVSILMFQAGVLSVGSTLDTNNTPKDLLYYVVAFLVGYREETFRQLIKQLVDVIFVPGKKEPSDEKPSGAAATGGEQAKSAGSEHP